MDQDPKAGERSIMRELVPDRRLARSQVLWTIRIVLGLVVVLSILTLVGWPFDVTLWDWLDLLIVPAVLAAGGYLFTRSENQRTRENTQQQMILDRDIANERRQDDMLQAYLVGMSQLLTDEKRPLHKAQLGDSLSTVARARTLTALSRLDPGRKRSVVQFLYESGLIARSRPVVDLHGAELDGAYLEGAYLEGANLQGANLQGANLKRTHLRGANLEGTKLQGANLFTVNLSKADLGNANLTEAKLEWANLGWEEDLLEGANLKSAILIRAHLNNAYLKGANLKSAILEKAHLEKAHLNSADLSRTFLRSANLGGADLSKAKLTEAYLGGADLSGADLSEADLGKTWGWSPEWTEEKLGNAGSLKGATMPDGQKLSDEMPNGLTFAAWLKDTMQRHKEEQRHKEAVMALFDREHLEALLKDREHFDVNDKEHYEALVKDSEALLKDKEQHDKENEKNG